LQSTRGGATNGLLEGITSEDNLETWADFVPVNSQAPLRLAHDLLFASPLFSLRP
jgi:hypothetical protein